VKTASGRSSSTRGSFKRKRSSQMDTLVSVLEAVDQLGARGREFGTTELRQKTGLAPSQAYTWLHVLRAHNFVSARLVASRRPSGDWRWKRKIKLVKL
jgi:hypothetical protein